MGDLWVIMGDYGGFKQALGIAVGNKKPANLLI
jgi:hypothetical protein